MGILARTDFYSVPLQPLPEAYSGPDHMSLGVDPSNVPPCRRSQATILNHVNTVN